MTVSTTWRRCSKNPKPEAPACHGSHHQEAQVRKTILAPHGTSARHRYELRHDGQACPECRQAATQTRRDHTDKRRAARANAAKARQASRRGGTSTSTKNHRNSADFDWDTAIARFRRLMQSIYGDEGGGQQT